MSGLKESYQPSKKEELTEWPIVDHDISQRIDTQVERLQTEESIEIEKIK